MKPQEFWDAKYRELIIYIKMRLIRINEDQKNEISIQEAATNKIIEANPLMFKSPKIKMIKDMFKDLFKQKEKEQSIEEQIAILRDMK
jgi:hypothetical protein